MRAFSVKKFGESPAIHDLPVPKYRDTYLIRVSFAGVNPVDYKLVERLTVTSDYPFVLGVDFAGVVEQVPDADTRFAVGDRVFGMARKHGTYATFTSSSFTDDDEPLTKIPRSVSEEEAACLPVPGITALGALDLLNLSPDQTIVILGATGAVGGLALQMAKARGANVIAVVRGSTEEAYRLGADDVVDSSSTDIYSSIGSRYPKKVDAVLDIYSGPEPIKKNADIIKAGGGLVSTIYSADTAWFANRNIMAHNISSSNNPLSTPSGLEQVVKLLEERVITSRVREVTALEDAGLTIAKLKKGGVSGKLLIKL